MLKNRDCSSEQSLFAYELMVLRRYLLGFLDLGPFKELVMQRVDVMRHHDDGANKEHAA
jgi:hypothetical protein